MNGHVLDDVSCATSYATLAEPALPWPFVHGVHVTDPTVVAYVPAPHATHDAPLGPFPFGHWHELARGSPGRHGALVQIPVNPAMLLL